MLLADTYFEEQDIPNKVPNRFESYWFKSKECEKVYGYIIPNYLTNEQLEFIAQHCKPPQEWYDRPEEDDLFYEE